VFNKVRAIVTIDLTLVVLALLLFVLLIPQYGALGAAMASTAVIVAQNIFYQIVLVRAGAVKLIDTRFLKVISIVLVLAAILFVIQSIFLPPIYVGFALATVASLLVLSITGPLLDIETAFPELKRFAAARWLLRFPDDLSVSGKNSQSLLHRPAHRTEDSGQDKR
jgi:O-antigen/teichoic acid export membrane protein